MNLLKLFIMCFVFAYILGIIITKIFEYKSRKLKVRDEKILFDKELSSLNETQLRAKEKELMKKITKYSFVETIFCLVLIVSFWYCYIEIQNNDKIMLAIVILILEVVVLIILWIIRLILKSKRYKCLTFIVEKSGDYFENSQKD